jgi:hypothetical protein
MLRGTREAVYEKYVISLSAVVLSDPEEPHGLYPKIIRGEIIDPGGYEQNIFHVIPFRFAYYIASAVKNKEESCKDILNFPRIKI